MTESSSQGPPAPAGPAPRTCGLAVASLVCGLAGLCTLGLSAIVGLVLGIMAHSKIARSGGRLGGQNLAIAGIAVSACAIVFGLLAGLPVIGLLMYFHAQSHTADMWERAREANEDDVDRFFDDLCPLPRGHLPHRPWAAMDLAPAWQRART